MREITAVSLFTGAGGMDIGFEHAGVRLLCANELNRDACDTYAANHPEVRPIRGDLADQFLAGGLLVPLRYFYDQLIQRHAHFIGNVLKPFGKAGVAARQTQDQVKGLNCHMVVVFLHGRD